MWHVINNEYNEGVNMVVAVIPAYNEEMSIASVILRTQEFVDHIIVVNDGSGDLTAEIAAKLGAIVVSHEKNQGKGAALRTGFRRAYSLGADIVVTLDADGQHNPSEIKQLIAPIVAGEADIVVGSRFLEPKGNEDMPFYRRVGNKILNMFTRTERQKITDTQSGFRAYSRKALEEISITVNGIGVDSQILIDASKKGLRIVEVPISSRYEGLNTSTYNPVRHTLSVILSIITFITEGKPLFYLGIPAVALLFTSIALFLKLLDIFNRTRYFSIEYALFGITALMIGIMLAIVSLVLYAIGKIAERMIVEKLSYYYHR